MASWLLFLAFSLLVVRPVRPGIQVIKPESNSQHEARTTRTWSLWVTLQTCGDVKITRVDLIPIGQDGPVTSSRNRLVILQWAVFDPAARGLTMGDMLVEMSRKRYQTRVFLKTAEGVSVRNLYWSPYGGSDRPLPALLDAREDERDRWFALHRWSPRHPYNPALPGFRFWFRELRRKFGIKMKLEVEFRGPGCKTPVQR